MNESRHSGSRNSLLVIILALTAIATALMIGASLRSGHDAALNPGSCLGVLAQHDSPVRGVAFSSDGALLAVGFQDGSVRVWGVADSRIAAWPLLSARKASTGERKDSCSYDVAFSPDSMTLAFGLPDGSVRLWQLHRESDGRHAPSHLQVTSLQTLRAEKSKTCSLDFAPDGRTLVAGAGNGSLHVWRVTDGSHLRSLKGHAGSVVTVAFSRDGTTLGSASLDRTILWDISAFTVIHELESPSVTTAVAFSPDGSLLVTASPTDNNKQLWSAQDWSPIRKLESARGGMGGVAFSPDSTLVAAGNAWYEVRWWRVSDGTLLRAAQGHRDSVNSVAFSPDGQMLASGSLDGTVRIWQVPSATALP